MMTHRILDLKDTLEDSMFNPRWSQNYLRNNRKLKRYGLYNIVGMLSRSDNSIFISNKTDKESIYIHQTK